MNLCLSSTRPLHFTSINLSSSTFHYQPPPTTTLQYTTDHIYFYLNDFDFYSTYQLRRGIFLRWECGYRHLCKCPTARLSLFSFSLSQHYHAEQRQRISFLHAHSLLRLSLLINTYFASLTRLIRVIQLSSLSLLHRSGEVALSSSSLRESPPSSKSPREPPPPTSSTSSTATTTAKVHQWLYCVLLLFLVPYSLYKFLFFSIQLFLCSGTGDWEAPLLIPHLNWSFLSCFCCLPPFNLLARLRPLLCHSPLFSLSSLSGLGKLPHGAYARSQVPRGAVTVLGVSCPDQCWSERAFSPLPFASFPSLNSRFLIFLLYLLSPFVCAVSSACLPFHLPVSTTVFRLYRANSSTFRNRSIDIQPPFSLYLTDQRFDLNLRLSSWFESTSLWFLPPNRQFSVYLLSTEFDWIGLDWSGLVFDCCEPCRVKLREWPVNVSLVISSSSHKISHSLNLSSDYLLSRLSCSTRQSACALYSTLQFDIRRKVSIHSTCGEPYWVKLCEWPVNV